MIAGDQGAHFQSELANRDRPLLGPELDFLVRVLNNEKSLENSSRFHKLVRA